MRFPEFLYAPREKGLDSTPPRRYADRREANFANIIVQAGHPLGGPANEVTIENVFVLTHLTALAVAGAGQNAIQLRAFVAEAATANLLFDIGRVRQAPAAFATFTFENLEVVMMPGERIIIQGDFDAGALTNSVFSTAYGWLLNRGNVQF